MASPHLAGFISVPLAFAQGILAAAWQQDSGQILQDLLLLPQNKTVDSFN